MRVESGTAPKPFEIRTVGDTVHIAFAENVETLPVDDDGNERYTFDAYTLETRASATVEQRISDNYEKWLAKAKASVPEPEPTAEEVLADLVEVLVDKGVIF